MNQEQKENIRNMLASIMKFDEPMATHTTFGIGGPAGCMVYPDNREELSEFMMQPSFEIFAAALRPRTSAAFK